VVRFINTLRLTLYSYYTAVREPCFVITPRGLAKERVIFGKAPYVRWQTYYDIATRGGTTRLKSDRYKNIYLSLNFGRIYQVIRDYILDQRVYERQ